MATAFDQAYHGWSHEDGNDSQDVAVSQMLDHGSISFGRYAVESLSWEKRSVFTHNKCQEELEKFRNPGIVAQKKAYFEEYYKRIRALKALQNQQTELTLDYGGDGSISSQNGEEEEIAGQPEAFGNGVGNSVNVLAEENKAQATMEEKDNTNSEAAQIGPLDMESTVSAEDLSAQNLGQEMNASNTVPMQHMDVGSSTNESMLRSIELTVQYDIIDLEHDGISRKYENSVADVEHEIAVQGATVPNLAREIVPQKTSSDHTSHKPGESKKPDSNLVKNMSTVKQHVDLVSASRRKKSTRNESKLENKTKSDKAKPSHGIKHSLQEASRKAERGIVSSKATSSKISGDKKSTSAASYRPLAEVRPNITIPRPFSLATERRAATSSVSKDAVDILDSKAPNRLASSFSRARGAMEVQGSFRKTATASAARSTGQDKRCQEVRDKHLASGNEGSEGRVALVVGLPKSRSVNLPAHGKSNPSGRTGLAAAIGQNKQKEIRGDSSSKDTHRTGTKNNTPPNGFLNTGNRQASKPLNNSTLDAKKQQIGSLSCDGRKPRRDMPRWR